MVPALVILYKHAFELNYTQSTLIVLLSYLTSSVSQPLFGMIADRKPRIWLLPAGVFCSIMGLALTGIAPSLPWLLLFISISGLGSGAFHPEASRGTYLASGNQEKSGSGNIPGRGKRWTGIWPINCVCIHNLYWDKRTSLAYTNSVHLLAYYCSNTTLVKRGINNYSAS